MRSGIVVDEYFRTARDGVYAIGDVAEFYDPLYKRHRRIEHWSNAAYHGTTLGAFLAGEDSHFDHVSSFFSEEFGKSFRTYGDQTGFDDTSLEGDFHGERALFRFAKSGKTIAAVTTGSPTTRQARSRRRSEPAPGRRIVVTLAWNSPRGGAVANTEIEQLSIDTIRTLSMDAVQQANAGHPGTAMALAPLAYLLYTEVLRHNPANPHWPNRDRFVLERRPRVHPAVLGAAPHGLRPLARGAEAASGSGSRRRPAIPSSGTPKASR